MPAENGGWFSFPQLSASQNPSERHHAAPRHRPVPPACSPPSSSPAVLVSRFGFSSLPHMLASVFVAFWEATGHPDLHWPLVTPGDLDSDSPSVLRSSAWPSIAGDDQQRWIARWYIYICIIYIYCSVRWANLSKKNADRKKNCSQYR